MKIYVNKTDKHKSWSIRLVERDGIPQICAVDSYSGFTIASLITFKKTGEVEIDSNARDDIDANDYHSSEHDNQWDDAGRLIINE